MADLDWPALGSGGAASTVRGAAQSENGDLVIGTVRVSAVVIDQDGGDLVGEHS